MDRQERDMLIRMAAQIEQLVTDVSEIKRRQEEQGKLVTDVALLQNEIRELRKERELYITREEFDPIKKIFYAVTTAVAIAMVTAVLALILV